MDSPFLNDALSVMGIISTAVALALSARWLSKYVLQHRWPTASSYIPDLLFISIPLLSLFVVERTIEVRLVIVATVYAVMAAVLSLSLQGTLKQVIDSGILIFKRFYRVGDLITVGAHTGEVRAVSVFATYLDCGHGKRVIINNSQILAGDITNHTVHGIYHICVDFIVHGHHDREAVQNAIGNSAAEYPHVGYVQVMHKSDVVGDLVVSIYTLIFPTANLRSRFGIKSKLSVEIGSAVDEVLKLAG